MRGNYKSPSELLLALRETGKSYWDLVGKPLTPNTGYNINNPHAAEESEYNKWYNGSKLSDEDNEKLQLFLEEYDKDIKSNSNSLPSYKGGKDKFTTFVERMGPKVYRQLHKQGIYNPYIYDNMMRLLAWESDYGTSPLAISNHNYGGVKSSNTEYAKYKDDDAFANYYVSLIRRKYPQAIKARDAKSYAKELKKVGYYEDSLQNYSQKLSNMSSVSKAAKLHMYTNPKQYEVEMLLDDLKKQAVQQPVSTRVEPPINREPINKEPFVNTPIPTKAPLITRPEYLESNSLIKKSFELNMNNMLLGKEFLFNLPGFKKGKDPKKPLSDEQYIKIMEDVANENYERWGYPNQDAALLYVLNANDYDYRGYYNKYPPKSANSLTHWPDEFKTVYHPSFSDESKYSGYKNKYNPDGIVGGHWYNEMFVPSFDQLAKRNKLPNKFKSGKDSGIKEYASNEDMHVNPDGSITTRNGNTGSVILPDVNVYAQKDYNSAFDYSGADDVMGTIADFTPVVGDVKQGLEAANDLRKGNYKEAAIGAGLLLLPNVLEKPLKYAGKKAFNFLLDKAPDVVSKYLLGGLTKPIYNERSFPAKSLYRADVYRGGKIRNPRNISLTTDPKYAEQYGEVTPYLFESKSVAKAEEPLMGYSDPVNNDMFIYHNTKDVPGANAIVGHDLVTGEFPYNSKGTEIISLSPNNIYPKRLKPSTIEWRDATKTPKITADNAANITPKQWTAAQDAAIAKGDMAEAQRLRDLHFKVSAPNTVVKNIDGMPFRVYHGTYNKGWVSYDKRKFGTATDQGMYGEGLYATSDKRYADVYARGNNADGTYKGEIKDLYVNAKKPFYVFNRKDLSPKEIVNREDAAYQFGRDLKLQGDIPNSIWDEMNNSDIVIETKGTKRPNFAEIVIPKGEQIKSANAVTYDDKGIRIPLGKRDNFKLNDIRYGVLPFGVGLTGYGLLNNHKTSRGSARKGNTKK